MILVDASVLLRLIQIGSLAKKAWRPGDKWRICQVRVRHFQNPAEAGGLLWDECDCPAPAGPVVG